MIGAVAGFWIGILRLQFRRRYNNGAATPYRGWMAWHHIAGLIGGVFVMTWLFSGWLSLDPGELFTRRDSLHDVMIRDRGQDQPRIAVTLPLHTGSEAVEARFVWLGGRPLIVLTDSDGALTVADTVVGTVIAPTKDQILTAAAQLLPAATMTIQEILTQPDAYWYSHGDQRPLPVLRVGFDDDTQTWFHIDPRSGDILGRMDNRQRAYRWLFNGLHRLDIPPLLHYHPGRDSVIWLLSMIGTIVSVSGIVIGRRRLLR